MAKSWVRLWLDMPTDPKFRTVSRRAKQPLALIIAFYTYLLTIAGKAESPGSVEKLSIDDAASAMDTDEEAIEAIVEAMQGRLIANGHLTGWKARQPEREDNSRERVRKHREKAKGRSKSELVTHGNACVTHGNAPDTDTDTDTDLTKDLSINSKVNLLPNSNPVPVPAAETAGHINFAKKMFKDIHANYPKAKQPNFQKWGRSIRLMIQADGRTMEELDRVWRYILADDFWHVQIRSPDNFRKHFDRIDAQRLAKVKKSTTRPPSEALADRYAWLKTAQIALNRFDGVKYNLNTDYRYDPKAYYSQPGIVNRGDPNDVISANDLCEVPHG